MHKYCKKIFSKYMLIMCAVCLTGTFFPYNVSYAQTTTSAEELKLAGGADARALFVQAKQFHDGTGGEQDFSKARMLYLKAAGMGSNDARINLGYLYFMGQGVAQNYAKARHWYLGAANNGDKTAQENLAMMYELGLGVKKDPAKVKYWREFGYAKSVVTLTIKPAKKSDKIVDKVPEIIANLTLNPVKISKENPVITTPKLSAKNTAKTDLRRPILMADNQNASDNGVPVWASNLLAAFMLALALVTGVWFAVQYSRLRTQKKAQIFATAFYAHHRDQLRINYLRYPLQNRKHGHIDDLWAGAMSTLMVKFAQQKQEGTDLLGEQSRKIVKALALSSIKARQAVFPFVDTIQQRIFADIHAHDCKPKDMLQHIRVQTVPKAKSASLISNVVNFPENPKGKHSSLPPECLWPDAPLTS